MFCRDQPYSVGWVLPYYVSKREKKKENNFLSLFGLGIMRTFQQTQNAIETVATVSIETDAIETDAYLSLTYEKVPFI